eukprot:2757493-Pleurochrysis_carterae.AAC.1
MTATEAMLCHSGATVHCDRRQLRRCHATAAAEATPCYGGGGGDVGTLSRAVTTTTLPSAGGVFTTSLYRQPSVSFISGIVLSLCCFCR